MIRKRLLVLGTHKGSGNGGAFNINLEAQKNTRKTFDWNRIL